MSTLSVAKLNKRYKSRIVVHDVSLSVDSGEVVGLLGPNGAGKTTCFYMIVGLVATDGGTIELDGDDLTRMPIHVRARLGLSYLPQEASIFRKLSVAENVQAILELQRIDTDEIANRLDALLEDLSISHLREASAVSLSGGERRRVEIARALATRPRFILLDEPFAGIDPIAVLDIQKIIGFLKEREIGVMITDHNVRETLGICDRAYIITREGCSHRGRPTRLCTTKMSAKCTSGSISGSETPAPAALRPPPQPVPHSLRGCASTGASEDGRRAFPPNMQESTSIRPKSDVFGGRPATCSERRGYPWRTATQYNGIRLAHRDS